MTDRLPVAVEDGAEHGRRAERASASLGVVLGKPQLELVRAAPRGRLAMDEAERWLVAAITGSEAEAADASAWLTSGPRLSARERLEIYRSGYLARLVECLMDDYPALAATLGHEAFEELCHAYVERYPSSSPSLNAFGRHMEALCRERLGGFHADLVRLEWALVEVIHAASPAPFDFASLASIPAEAWGGVRFTPSPAARLLRFEHPVNPYYGAWRTTDAVPARPGPAPSATVVYRRNMLLYRMDLTPAMARVLEALFDGLPLGEALARMGADETNPEALAEAERSVMIWFRAWVDGTLFSGAEAPAV